MKMNKIFLGISVAAILFTGIKRYDEFRADEVASIKKDCGTHISFMKNSFDDMYAEAESCLFMYEQVEESYKKSAYLINDIGKIIDYSLRAHEFNDAIGVLSYPAVVLKPVDRSSECGGPNSSSFYCSVNEFFGWDDDQRRRNDTLENYNSKIRDMIKKSKYLDGENGFGARFEKDPHSYSAIVNDFVIDENLRIVADNLKSIESRL